MFYAIHRSPVGESILHAFESVRDRERFVDNLPTRRESVPAIRAWGAYARIGAERVILHETCTLRPAPPIEYRHGFTVWILPDVQRHARAAGRALSSAIRESL